MKRYIFPIALVLALAGGAYLLLLATMPTQPLVHAEAPTPDIAATAPAAAPPKRPSSANTNASPPEDAPAWLRSTPDSAQSRAGAMPNPADRAASAAEENRAVRMQAVMTKLQRLQSDPQPQPREILAAINELENINGSSVVGGVRLDVLRNNVLVVEKIQALSNEVQKLQGSASVSAPQNLAFVQAKMAEMEALRGQLRSDVMQPGAPVTLSTSSVPRP